MGPLKGVKVIEIAGIGPGPFAGMLLADMGAEVISVEKRSGKQALPDCARRGKRSIALNLKSAEGIEALLKLVEKADILFEGFRPGVMERLGAGPDECLARNPALVYGRMTGWGQFGPLAKAAGHDINYISLTGSLHAIGRAGDKPVPPLNLVGDYGGGGMFLVMGMLAALLEARQSGKGQVVDAAMTDGSAVLMAMFHSLQAMGMWKSKRGYNFLDSGAHFYDVYETQDGKYVSIGSIEPQFYALLLEKAQLDPQVFGNQNNPALWPDLKDKLAAVFKTKTQAQWCELMEGSDVCFAPVLDFNEAATHPHNAARQTYIEVDGMTQPAPAPRFSRTASQVQFGSRPHGADTQQVLSDWGFSDTDLDSLKAAGGLS
ncbi:L-carnitine dehydratase/bile acid-inducible protein F [Oceanococcus atlanticus]|uniref:L-carnitine dehydratase/bile acid-inducible protein F n=1 Tax=Oceanococcus atlanticus TaxID=1317117 RepID=A0A1Y1SD64_9GAMM|nr:CaiB/BaiF CoA-transferase family protein [Oceanococcus atlanticus]ORE86909.1 L-carnitine dehydratase/bile acid-inducible protein F [Oceanococcus atlanticus]RZO83729.1 MAG: CoA transferase [Oceanococcus sp.]